MLNEEAVRADFPILGRIVHGKPLAYLDSAATSQKPRVVVEAIADYYFNHNANVHRGIHTLGDEATEQFEQAREAVARFINARDPREVIFVRNTTEAINLVARAWGGKMLGPGDEVWTSAFEHHSNLVPWQQIAAERGATTRYFPMDDEQALPESALDQLTARAKLVSVVHVSNAFGTINPVERIAEAAHQAGAVLLLDAAQSAPHMPVDVQALDCDFLAFSGHKMCGPMGVGVLWARLELLEQMDPFLGGGSMIQDVYYDHATWAAPPHKFEAGTPNVADAIGLEAAIRYLEGIGMANVRAHERELVSYGLDLLGGLPGVRVYGPSDPDRHGGVLSFTVEGLHPHDLGTILDSEGIAIRSGQHCCHPAMRSLGISGTARASVYLYTIREELDRLAVGIARAREVFALA
ncbi:MAG: cysteine desulfurase [Dehalococcoidia bacterium]